MKIIVDLNRCQCYAQCAFLAPNVFEIDGEEALMYTPNAPEQERERVRRAVSATEIGCFMKPEVADAETGARSARRRRVAGRLFGHGYAQFKNMARAAQVRDVRPSELEG